ncbi:MAG: hypothetical protein QXS37_02190 [Candidatus Aenigmatarchaeota archaeon]
MFFPPRGAIKITTDKEEYLPGEDVKVNIDFTLEESLETRGLILSLVCEAWFECRCVSGRRQKHCSTREILYKEEVMLIPPGKIENMKRSFSHIFNIPKDAFPSQIIPTFGTSYDLIGWKEYKEMLAEFKELKSSGYKEFSEIMETMTLQYSAGIKWYVNAKLDVPMRMDIADEMYIFVK